MTKVYALIDKGLLNNHEIDIKEFCNFLNKLNIPVAQYRNKTLNRNDILRDLQIIKNTFNGTLILNDYIDYIEYADGLHIGQEDLQTYGSIDNIRVKIKNKILGLSTHNLKEIETANTLDIDYIGLGAYRPTKTKDILNIGGRELLDISRKSKHKVAIIGGVKLSDNFDSHIAYKVIGSDLFKRFIELNGN